MMDVDATATSSKKRTADLLVDPDTRTELPDPKRPKILLDASKKAKCLKLLVVGHDLLVSDLAKSIHAILVASDDKLTVETVKGDLEVDIILSTQITSILFTCHNLQRQKVKGVNTNLITKAVTSGFNIHLYGKDYTLPRQGILDRWVAEATKLGLSYKNFQQGDEENWYGTMGPYLDMFAAFKLRLDELRLGHGTMPITKKDGVHTSFPVSKYGLSGAHHILLEGSSYPPERRSSIVQSLGPMTVFICMLRSEGIYRAKYAAAVKRAMAHIPGIDDIIEITKTIKTSYELNQLINTIAEILLITTSRQATRMCFPLCMFVKAYNGTTPI